MVGLGAGHRLAHLPPAAHDDRAVGDLDDVVHRVGDDDHALALAAEPHDQVEDAL